MDIWNNDTILVTQNSMKRGILFVIKDQLPKNHPNNFLKSRIGPHWAGSGSEKPAKHFTNINPRHSTGAAGHRLVCGGGISPCDLPTTHHWWARPWLKSHSHTGCPWRGEAPAFLLAQRPSGQQTPRPPDHRVRKVDSTAPLLSVHAKPPPRWLG